MTTVIISFAIRARTFHGNQCPFLAAHTSDASRFPRVRHLTLLLGPTPQYPLLAGRLLSPAECAFATLFLPGTFQTIFTSFPMNFSLRQRCFFCSCPTLTPSGRKGSLLPWLGCFSRLCIFTVEFFCGTPPPPSIVRAQTVDEAVS